MPDFFGTDAAESPSGIDGTDNLYGYGDDDTIDGRDGTDILTNVDYAGFADRQVGLQAGQDVLFVIDQSASMGDDISAVRANAPAVATSIFNLDNRIFNTRPGIVANERTPDTIQTLTDHANPEDRKAAFGDAITNIRIFLGTENLGKTLIHGLDVNAGS